MRTAKQLGYRVIAVYSEADTNALHILNSSEAVLIGLRVRRNLGEPSTAFV